MDHKTTIFGTPEEIALLAAFDTACDFLTQEAANAHTIAHALKTACQASRERPGDRALFDRAIELHADLERAHAAYMDALEAVEKAKANVIGFYS